MIKRRIFTRLKTVSPLRLTLINMGLLDELISGFSVIGLPLLHEQLGLSYAQIGLLFSIPALASTLIEPVMYLLSDRGSKRWWILGGLLGLVLASLLAGSIPTFPVLLIAFALGYPSTGAAVGLSQAALIDSAPHESARTMTRWTMLSSIGDFLSPLAVTTILAAGLGWPGLCRIAAGCWLVVAIIIVPQRFPARSVPASQHGKDEVAERGKAGWSLVGLVQDLRQGLLDKVLLRWAVLSGLTCMLDEIFLTFAILYLRDVLHANTLIIGIIVACQMLGTLLGLLLMDRLLGRISPLRLLTIASWLALTGIAGLLVAHILWFTALSLVVMSVGSACLYPIVEAEAYNRQPGRSGTVRAIIQLSAPFEIALPGIVGLIAGSFGLLASLAFLGSAPLLFLIIAPRSPGRPRG